MKICKWESHEGVKIHLNAQFTDIKILYVDVRAKNYDGCPVLKRIRLLNLLPYRDGFVPNAMLLDEETMVSLAVEYAKRHATFRIKYLKDWYRQSGYEGYISVQTGKKYSIEEIPLSRVSNILRLMGVIERISRRYVESLVYDETIRCENEGENTPTQDACP